MEGDNVKVSSNTLKYFLNKKVRIIRTSNKFVYIGILKDFDSNAIVLEDRIAGITYLPISDIHEIKKNEEQERRPEPQYAD